MLLPALLLVGAAAPSPVPPTLVRHRLVEARHAVTPQGVVDRSLAGTISVAEGKARWDLEPGTFPRSRASAAIVEGTSVTLLDPKEKVATDVGLETFDALFTGRPGDPDATPPSLGDVTVEVRPDGAGGEFQGLPTRRFRVKVAYTLRTLAPGQVAFVKHETAGRIETLPEGEDALSPFDDLARLFPGPQSIRERIEKELSHVPGLPVSVSLESSSEAHSEPVGAPVGASSGGSHLVRTSVTVRRTVSLLSREPLTPEEAARFTTPGTFHHLPPVRLLTDENLLR